MEVSEMEHRHEDVVLRVEDFRTVLFFRIQTKDLAPFPED
jgi:hypothetical protein